MRTVKMDNVDWNALVEAIESNASQGYTVGQLRQIDRIIELIDKADENDAGSKEVSLEDQDHAFLSKTWSNLQFRANPSARRQVLDIYDALKGSDDG